MRGRADSERYGSLRFALLIHAANTLLLAHARGWSKAGTAVGEGVEARGDVGVERGEPLGGDRASARGS